MTTIKIILGKDILSAELFDTPTAQAILKALPLKVNVSRWGDEIYFPIPVYLKLEKTAQQEVNVGDLAYWPEGHAFCIFYGKTPASLSDKPRAYSPVNVFGTVHNAATLKKNTSTEIIIDKDYCWFPLSNK